MPAIAESEAAVVGAPARGRARLEPWWFVGLLAGLPLVLPGVAVASTLARPHFEVLRHLAETILPAAAWDTLILVVGVGGGAGVLGVSLGWLMATRRFPGSRVLSWALLLPLAMPAYVVGFAWVGLLEYGGPVETLLAWVTGSTVRLPEVRSRAGLIVAMSLVLYPYVYLVARAAFAGLSATLLEAARTLGCTGPGAFFRVALPAARPALVAGIGLAMMEALSDFGTVAVFGGRTFTVAIYRTWFGLFDREAAGQLAALLMGSALLVLGLERVLRGRSAYAQPGATQAARPLRALRGAWGFFAAASCVALLCAAFFVPAGVLGYWSSRAMGEGYSLVVLGALAARTLALAAAAAVAAATLGLFLAYAARVTKSRLLGVVARLASLSYATPGAVVALGSLSVLALADRMLRGAGLIDQTTLLFTGSAVGLVYAYTCRFSAVALLPLEAGLARVPRTLDDAARTLGSGATAALGRVHLPLLKPSLVAASLLVFLDVMKEMPATLLMRPLGWDTLAVEVWLRTSESQWVEAAPAALAIVICGLPVVMLLARHRISS